MSFEKGANLINQIHTTTQQVIIGKDSIINVLLCVLRPHFACALTKLCINVCNLVFFFLKIFLFYPSNQVESMNVGVQNFVYYKVVSIFYNIIR